MNARDDKCCIESLGCGPEASKRGLLQDLGVNDTEIPKGILKV
jgi:hypothetical protein